MAAAAQRVAEDFDPRVLQSLDDWLRKLVERQELPFAELQLARGGLVQHRYRGCHPDLPRGQLDQSSLFRIYSMTKPMTGLAMMILYERGLWAPADRLADLIPAFDEMRVLRQDADTGELSCVKARNSITLLHLLTHTAGLTHGLDPGGYTNPLDPMYHGSKPLPELAPEAAPPAVAGPKAPEVPLEEWVNSLAKYPLMFEPGTQYWYSYGIDVLGRVIELLSKRTLDQFFQAEIFDPLGMMDSYFRVPVAELGRVVPNFSPHRSGQGLHDISEPTSLKFQESSKQYLSAGTGVVSTLADFYKFAELLRGRGRCPATGVRLIGPRTFQFMTANQLPDDQTMAELSTNPIIRSMTTRGVGMGFGVACVVDPVRFGVMCSPGTIFWGGAASTQFWVDPKEELVCVFFTQLMITGPSNLQLVPKLHQFVSSALTHERTVHEEIKQRGLL